MEYGIKNMDGSGFGGGNGWILSGINVQTDGFLASLKNIRLKI
jgi:hypothetical protein